MPMIRYALSIVAVALTLFSQGTPAFAVNWNLVNFGYDGGGVEEGIDEAENLGTDGSQSARETIVNILYAVFSFLGIIAVLVIVIAGLILIVQGGEDGQREKARNMVLYAVIGLILVTLAGALVRWVDETFAG